MLRRVVFTLIVLAGVGVAVPAAYAQTSTSTPVAPTTTRVAPTTAVTPTTRPVATTTKPRTTTTTPSTSTSTSTTSTTIAPAKKDDSGISGRTVGLIVGASAVLILLGIVIWLLIRQRKAKRWTQEAAQAAVEGRSVLGLATHGLATLDQPAAAALTWSDLDTQGAQLHQRLQTLGRRPPEPRLGDAVGRTDQSLQALRSAADADRALRLGPPPPTTEQLGYSEAILRQRAADFEQELGGLDAALARGQ